MSRWLKSVNALLENLDDQVGEVIEEGVDLRQGGPTSSSVEDILNKRGLGAPENHSHMNDGDDDPGESDDLDDNLVDKERQISEDVEKSFSNNSLSMEKDHSETNDTEGQFLHYKDASNVENTMHSAEPEQFDEDNLQVTSNQDKGQSNVSSQTVDEVEESGSDTKSSEPEYEKVELPKEEPLSKDKNIENQAEVIVPTDINQKINVDDKAVAMKLIAEQKNIDEKMNLHSGVSRASDSPSLPPVQISTNSNTDHAKQNVSKVNLQLKQYEKEVRKLRRNVVNLNSQLESLEHEMSAQSTELKQAAERMERDRLRHKETITRLQTEHKNSNEQMQTQYLSDMETMKESYRLEQVEWSKKLQEAEQARAKEGGSYQEDLQQAIEREQKVLQKCIFLQEDKSTLENQVHSLETQLSSLETLFQSVKKTGETAMEREREAEDKLDATLSLHAKQIGVRLSREQELERTIADLTAALVVEKQKQQPKQSRSKQYHQNEDSMNPDMTESILDEPSHHNKETQDQLDMIKAQLDIEKLKTSTLQQELEDVSRERTEEEADHLAQLRQNERKMSDVQATIMHLQAQLKTKRDKEVETDDVESSNENQSKAKKESKKLHKQITALSEQNMKQQTKIEKCHSEISTLNNRLHQAVQRANLAEDRIKTLDLEAATNEMMNPTISLYGRNSNNPSKITLHRRRKRNKKDETSIREALQVNNIPYMDGNELFIGQSIDKIDRWSLELGKFLRSSPLARLAFLLYMIVLHLWGFFLIIIQAHAYDLFHGDYQGGSGHVGVENMLHHSYRVQEQLPRQP